jgi:hypothetical protein
MKINDQSLIPADAWLERKCTVSSEVVMDPVTGKKYQKIVILKPMAITSHGKHHGDEDYDMKKDEEPIRAEIDQEKADLVRDILEEFNSGWVEGPSSERILFDDDQDCEIEVTPQCREGSDEMVDFVYIRGASAHPSGLRSLEYPGEFAEWLQERSVTELRCLYVNIPC